MNIPLLDRLREVGGSFVPWPTLAEGWHDAAGDLEELVAYGFGIERHPFHGAAYRGPAERLCPDQIEWDLGTALIGRRIAVWDRVTSTNDLAARAGSSRSNDGLAIFAEEQTSGRGRRGRRWSAPPRSSILVSVLIFPTGPIDDPGWLTALGAVAVSDVLAEMAGVHARIKWPNDVRVDRRKVAGILVERGAGAVVGIGINVNVSSDMFPPDLAETATSIRALVGSIVDRSEVARLLLRSLDRWYGAGMRYGPESLDEPVQARSEHLGRDVRITTREGYLEGRLARIEFSRGLTIRLGQGREALINSRDVLALATID